MADSRIDIHKPAITPEMRERIEIRSARKVYERSAQAESPSKDFYQLVVTEKGVLLRWWILTLRHGQKPVPNESVATCEDFPHDAIMLSDIERVFGVEVKEDALRIVRGGELDQLSRLPTSLFIHEIAIHLDLTSLFQLGRVSRHFRLLCHSNALWEKMFYGQNVGGVVADEVKELAREVGWKKVYFTNKLKLRMQVARLREKRVSKEEMSAAHHVTFLTENKGGN